MQIVFLDVLLDLVTDHLSLLLVAQFLLVCVSLGTRLHLLYIDTLHLSWKSFACQGSMGNPLNVSIQCRLLLVLFGGFTELGRLLLREEEGIIAEHLPGQLGLLRIRFLSHANFASLVYTLGSSDYIRPSAAFPARRIHRFHFQNNGRFISLFEFVELLSGRFCEAGHFLDVFRLRLAKSAHCVLGRHSSLAYRARLSLHFQ